MKKLLALTVFGALLAACEQKMDACECGKRMIDKDSKALLIIRERKLHKAPSFIMTSLTIQCFSQFPIAWFTAWIHLK